MRIDSLGLQPYPLRRSHRNLSWAFAVTLGDACCKRVNATTVQRDVILSETFDLANFIIESKKSYRLELRC